MMKKWETEGRRMDGVIEKERALATRLCTSFTYRKKSPRCFTETPFTSALSLVAEARIP